MQSEIKVGQQVVRFDAEATKRLYVEAMAVAGADSCDCASCRNFAAQRNSVYPGDFVSLLKRLGVNPLVELEAFDYDFDLKQPRHLYGGWFPFCGELLEGADWRPEHNAGASEWWFTESFPSLGISAEKRVCAVEFLVEVPWTNPEESTVAHRS